MENTFTSSELNLIYDSIVEAKYQYNLSNKGQPFDYVVNEEFESIINKIKKEDTDFSIYKRTMRSNGSENN